MVGWSGGRCWFGSGGWVGRHRPSPAAPGSMFCKMTVSTVSSLVYPAQSTNKIAFRELRRSISNSVHVKINGVPRPFSPAFPAACILFHQSCLPETFYWGSSSRYKKGQRRGGPRLFIGEIEGKEANNSKRQAGAAGNNHLLLTWTTYDDDGSIFTPPA